SYGCRHLIFACTTEISNEARQPGYPETDVCPSGRDLHPLDQKPDDTRLLGRKQRIPQRFKAFQRLTCLVFRKVRHLGARCNPRPGDDLRFAQQRAYLVDYCSLDLGGGDPADDVLSEIALQCGLADVVTVQLAMSTCMRWRHGTAVGAED